LNSVSEPLRRRVQLPRRAAEMQTDRRKSDCTDFVTVGLRDAERSAARFRVPFAAPRHAAHLAVLAAFVRRLVAAAFSASARFSVRSGTACPARPLGLFGRDACLLLG